MIYLKPLILVLLTFIAVFLFNPTVDQNVSYHSYDFFSGKIADLGHAYASAWLVANSFNPYETDLLQVYKTLDIQTQHLIPKATNPPSLILLQMPLLLFSPSTAFYVWFGLKVILFFLSLFMLVKIVNIKKTLPHFLTLSLLCLSGPVLADLYEGQINIILLFLFSLGLYLFQKRSLWSYVFWGVLSSLKFFTLPLIIFAFIQSRFKGLFYFVLGFLSLYLLFGIVFGFELIFNYFTNILSGIYQDYSIRVINRNLANTIFLLVNNIFDNNSLSITSYNQLSFGLLVSFCLCLIFYLSYVYRSKSQFNFANQVCIVLALAVLISPIAWEHYYVLFIPLIVTGYKCYVEKQNFSKIDNLFPIAFFLYLMSNKILFYFYQSQSKLLLFLYAVIGLGIITLVLINLKLNSLSQR